jgi:hypothetical protein
MTEAGQAGPAPENLPFLCIDVDGVCLRRCNSGMVDAFELAVCL